jgi:hypothetical protein
LEGGLLEAETMVATKKGNEAGKARDAAAKAASAAPQSIGDAVHQIEQIKTNAEVW